MTASFCVYVINLDRSPERLAHAQSEMSKAGLEFTRLAAVDARSLAGGELSAAVDAAASRRDYYVPLHAGEVACFLSHRRAWETFLNESSAPVAVILEDDFSFTAPPLPALSRILSMDIGELDMIKLFSRRKGIGAVIGDLGDGRRLVRHRVVSTRTVGQLVTRRGAERLLATTLPIRRPIDVQLQFWWELSLRIAAVYPSLVIDASPAIEGSTLGRGERRSFERVRRELGRATFRARLWGLSNLHYWRNA